MPLELAPPPDPCVAAAVAEAVERSGLELNDVPVAYLSPWRAAGLAEAAGRMPPAPVPHDEPAYSALSPRSTRGATRA